MIQEERLVQTFLDLVQLDSESKHERQVADYAIAKLRALGYEVQEDQAGDSIGGSAGNVLAYKKGSCAGKSLLFCSHMDTVVPGNGVKPVVENGIIRSDGTTVLGGDDKAGMAAILETATALNESGAAHGPLQIIFTIAEEIGLLGAKQLDFAQLAPVDAAFFFDSEGLPSDICVASPYHIDVTVTFKGRAAHAGMEPEKGISAIQMAAAAITAMQLGRLDEETTANIGIIQGGRATNVVANETVIHGEARSMEKEKADHQISHMIQCCRQAAEQFGGQAEIKVEECYAAIQLDPDSTTVRLASQAVRCLGLEPKLTKSGGGSDANIFNGQGIPAANLGVGMTKVHSVEEYLQISKMKTAAEFILTVIEEAKA